MKPIKKQIPIIEKTAKQLEQELESKKQEERNERGEKMNSELSALCEKYNCELIADVRIVGKEISTSVMIYPK